MVLIDGTDLILGRFATVISKRALLGEKIDIVNCENIIVTGDKKTILIKYKERVARGNPQKGPFFKKMPDRFVRRAIRGMLPYKQDKGIKAFKNIMCYIGIPKEFSEIKPETIESAKITKGKILKYTTVGEICKNLK
ncbi:50S ribosomal protein L13 [archaeon]|jgi:large subunit ribosomal protein L13|nr:50S ribosomal protein L13 [archaeon]